MKTLSAITSILLLLVLSCKESTPKEKAQEKIKSVTEELKETQEKLMDETGKIDVDNLEKMMDNTNETK